MILLTSFVLSASSSVRKLVTCRASREMATGLRSKMHFQTSFSAQHMTIDSRVLFQAHTSGGSVSTVLILVMHKGICATVWLSSLDPGLVS